MKQPEELGDGVASKRRRWILVIAIGLSLLVVMGVFRGKQGRGVQVDLGKIERRDVFRSTVTASGEIVAQRFADIGSDMMGRIVSLPVVEGQAVRAGQLLAQIDPVSAKSDADAATAQMRAVEADARAAGDQANAAQADLELARVRSREADLQLSRISNLRQQGLVPQSELDQAQAAADTARAQVASAEAAAQRAASSRDAAQRRIAQARAQSDRASNLSSKTAITSPIDGIVSRLQVREGEMVVIGIQNQPGTTLMTVSDLSAINAEVKVAEADVLQLAVGQRAEVSLEAVPGRTFTGKVHEIGASALPQTGAAAAREFRVVVRLDDPDGSLRPGLTCDAEIQTAERNNVLVAPLQAVVLRPSADGKETRGVFLMDDGKARFTPVETGLIGGLDMEVRGLDEGAEVIAGPYQVLRDLKDGDAVKVAKAGAKG